MIDYLIGKLLNYQREFESPNHQTYKRTLLKFFTILAIFSIAADIIFETVLYLNTAGLSGYPDIFYLFILSIAVIVFIIQISSAEDECSDFSGHLFILSLLFTAIRTFDKYDNFIVSGILITTSIFLAGTIIRPIYSYVYGVITSFITLLITESSVDIGEYESIIVIYILIASYAYFFSKTVEMVFKSSNQKSEEIKNIYENDKILFSDLAHKLKTPLTIMRNEIDIGMRRKEIHTGTLERLNNVIKEMDLAINDLTTVSRMSLSKVSATKKPVNLDKLLTKIIKDALILAKSYETIHGGKRTIILKSKNKAANNKYVFIAEEQIREAILNVIHNSIIHNPESESVNIFITIRKRGGFYSIWISDDGKGIPAREYKQIIEQEKFMFKGQKKESINKVGHIGLSIVTNIIRSNGGKFHLYTREQVGTRAEILLPAI